MTLERTQELRLMAKVASLYYEGKQRQADIAAQLDLSQATVSRLLKRALEEKIVRISVSTPMNCYPDLENAIQSQYALKEVIVVDSSADYSQLLLNIGAAGAFYLETTIADGEMIGISSWSETLLAAANAMHPLSRATRATVVQLLGGTGNPNAEMHPSQLTRRLASLVHGDAVILPVPGIVGSRDIRDILVSDPSVNETIALFDQVTLALVGIGAIEPSRVLASSGNVFSHDELEALRKQGAVGDLCQHFFNAEGQPVESPLNDRVIGITLQQLKQVRRTVAMAGGERKLQAIRGALRGAWIDVLITDSTTAEGLVEATSRPRP